MAASASDGQKEDAPVFDLSGWSPEAPAGLHFLSLLPFPGGYEIGEHQKHDLKTKVKGHCGRQLRRHEFHKGHTLGRDIHDEKRLRNAACAGDACLVEELLDCGVDPQSQDIKKRTALHIAAAKGNPDVVSLLLAGGADPNQRDSLGNTPLHLGTDVNALDRGGRTPLHLAMSRLHLLKADTATSSVQLKQEVNQVVGMMKQYLQCTGRDEVLTELEGLTSHLEAMDTRQELDSLNSLLSDFASLQIKKERLPS